MTFVEWTTLSLSAIAVLVSIWAAHRANSAQAAIVEIETARELDRVRDTKRASLTARFIRHSDGMSASFVVTNTGNAAARDIQIIIDGKPLSEHHHLIFDNDRPLGVVGPGTEIEYGISTWNGMPDHYNVQLRWTDGTTERGEWDSQLVLARG